MNRPKTASVTPDSDMILRPALALAGAILLVSAWLAGVLAVEHMEAARALCGSDGLAHCGWCPASAALTLSGLAALGLAASPVARSASAS